MNWPKQLTLRTKLTGLVAGLLALISAVLLTVLPPRVNATCRNWAERRAEAVVIILANAVAPGLDFDDASHVARQLEGLKRAPGAIYAGVRYADGKLLASWPEKDIPEPSLAAADWPETPLVYEKDGLIRAEVAVTTMTGQRGLLQAGFSVTELKTEMSQNLSLVGMLAFGVFLMGSVAAFAIGNVLSRPLRQMRNVALRLAGGDITGAEAALKPAGLTSGSENSPDEVTGLASSFARMLAALRSTTVSLQESAGTLTSSVERLSVSSAAQGQGLKRHAESLSHAKESAQEVRTASDAAASQVQAVLEVALLADRAGGQGEAAIMESLSGMNDIRTQVKEISRRISGLGERIAEAEVITTAVHELTGQSQMLSLNASIEAARAGEHGRGFVVIAHHLRRLAEQSVNSTRQIQGILSELVAATGQVVAFTESGMERVEASVGQMRSSSERLRELTTLARNSAEAVRSIAAAVKKQDEGVDVISDSMSELSRMMDDTMERLMAVDEAMSCVDTVAKVVATAAQTFRT